MSKTSRYTTLILRKLWTAIAVLLVLVALTISLLRYSLPMLDERKHLIEEYVLNEYGVDLSIGSVAASWQSRGPTLEFADVHLKQNAQSPLNLKVGELYLAVEFWPSVFSGKLQSRNVTLEDLHASIDLQRLSDSSSDFPVVQALESIFMEQLTRFSVRNSEFTIVNKAAQNTVRIRQLSWLNKNNRHQGFGELSLDGIASNTALFVLNLTGDVESYDGTFYAKGQALDISPWIDEFTDLDNRLITSKGNFELWADIDQGRFTHINGQVLESEFAFKTLKNEKLQTSISASFSAIPKASSVDTNQQNWLFSVRDLALGIEDERINTSWVGSYSEVDGISLYNKAPFSIAPLRPLVALYSANAHERLEEMDIQSRFERVHLQVEPSGLSMIAQNNHLSWQESGNIVGIDSLRLDLFVKEQEGFAQVRSKDSILKAQNLLERNIDLVSLDLPIWFEARQGQWSVMSDEGSMVSDALTISPDFSFRSATGNLSLIADIEGFKLNRVPSLLPNDYMSAAAKDYLSAAFVGEGQVENAHILWHGRGADFPFENNEGVFQASVAIDNAEFVFSDAWPMLNNLDIDLLFENKLLEMKASTGLLAGVELSNLRASIDDLGASGLLTIEADGKSTGSEVAELMSQSTLADSLGRVLSQDVLVKGDVTTDLALYIPLSEPSQTRAVGKAILNDSQVRITALGLDFDQANGEIAYDNDKLSIAGLRANLLEQPVDISLSSEQVDDIYRLAIGITGQWDAAPILASYAPQLQESIVGSSQWDLNLDVDLKGSDYQYQANFRSSLTGIDSSLPLPLAKQASDTLALTLNATGNKVASNIQARLGSDVNFEGVLPHKEKQFSRAHLALGQTDFVGMGVGFSISANLPSVDADKWFASVKALVGGLEKSDKSILSVPERIFAQADQLLVSGTRLSDVDITAKRLDKDWQLDITSDQVRSTVDISSQWVSKGIRVDADYIHLEDLDLSIDATSQERAFEPQSMPLIRLNCKSCEIGDIDLGRVVLEAAPNDDGLEITRLEVDAESGNIKATGQWYKRHEAHYTFLAGDLNSNDFGRFLADFGLESGIKDSGANMDFALTWQDSPMDFGFKTLDGKINWSLSDGYLTEVSDQGSRIFTLLSLNSLVRKLSLDFRDVFAKGFFYDDMKGSIQVTEGKADTRDTEIDGAAGDIEIYGYTDLVSKELNYNVSFTPNVTGNLPVLVYFFTVSPPSALAALALDQVLTSAKVISNVNYSVSGTIDDPVLIETGRQSTDVELPTRRDPLEESEADLFTPPTVDDLLPLEQGDG